MEQRTHRTARRIARECLAMRARRLDRVVTRLYDDALRPYGLKSTQFTFLVAIAGHAAVRPAELGRLLDVEKSTVSRNTARLIERGWVVARDADDARGSVLSLSPAGVRLVDRAYPGWKAAQRRVRAVIGPAAASGLESVTSE